MTMMSGMSGKHGQHDKFKLTVSLITELESCWTIQSTDGL